jgi:hypothetical protein
MPLVTDDVEAARLLPKNIEVVKFVIENFRSVVAG